MLDKCNRLELEKLLQLKHILKGRSDWFRHPIDVVSYILHPLWRSESDTISPDLVFPKLIDQNAIDDELLQFLHKGPFGREAALVGDAMLCASEFHFH